LGKKKEGKCGLGEPWKDFGGGGNVFVHRLRRGRGGEMYGVFLRAAKRSLQAIENAMFRKKGGRGKATLDPDPLFRDARKGGGLSV